MSKLFHDYFNYTKGQKSGIIVLVVLIIIVFVLPQFIDLILPTRQLDYSEFESQISQFEQKVESKKESKKAVELFMFDPNTTNEKDLAKLGFNTKQINQIIKYRQKGGSFKTPSDLLKIYSIDSIQFLKIEPFISIKKSEKQSDIFMVKSDKSPELNKTIEIKAESIEINSADSIDLIKLEGIGVSLSKRIINYRNYLGGFHNKKQLYEVYGLKSETVEKILGQIHIDTTLIQFIDINVADFKTLNKHPYISYATTKKILKYRELMGEIKTTNELIANNLIDSVSYYKIKPYLQVY